MLGNKFIVGFNTSSSYWKLLFADNFWQYANMSKDLSHITSNEKLSPATATRARTSFFLPVIAPTACSQLPANTKLSYVKIIIPNRLLDNTYCHNNIGDLHGEMCREGE